MAIGLPVTISTILNLYQAEFKINSVSVRVKKALIFHVQNTFRLPAHQFHGFPLASYSFHKSIHPIDFSILNSNLSSWSDVNVTSGTLFVCNI